MLKICAKMEGSSTSSNQSSSSSSSSSDHNSNEFIPSIDSYDGKVMLAAIISLLVVVSFVLLLHIYTRWLLQQQTHQRRRQSGVSTLYVLNLEPTRSHHQQNRIRTDRALINDTTTTGSSSMVDKGLDASIISSLPLFIYKKSDDGDYSNGGELDCVICLSSFEDDEMGRNLPNCKHSFHVECVDMWLHSHSRCPICRAIVVVDKPTISKESSINLVAEEGSHRELASGDESDNTNVDILTTSPSGIPIQIIVSSNSNIETTSSFKDSPSALPAESSSSFGCSLKRMLSRSRSERKVFPSSSSAMINELNV